MITQSQAQLIFQGLLQSLLWRFSTDLHTIEYEDYIRLLNEIEPQNYEVAYNLNDINYIEKGTVEDEGVRLNSIIRERTWTFSNTQAFELQVTTIPSLILTDKATKIPQPNTLTSTFWVNEDGTVVAYRQILNSAVIHNENYIEKNHEHKK